MIRFAALLFALLPSIAMGADAIIFEYDAGSTLYARVYTSSSTAVAAALTAGTSGNTRFYYVTDDTLAGAGLSGTANYVYTIFTGTPSTSAADTAVGAGMLRWNSTAADDVAGKAALDAVPTAAENAAQLIATTATGSAGTVGKLLQDTAGTVATNLDMPVSEVEGGTGGPGAPDARDLEPVQHTFQLKRSGTGTLQSTNAYYVNPGDGSAGGLRIGWNCDIPSILPTGTVIGGQSDPELVTPSDDIDITVIGHGEKVAKVQIEIAADAAPGSHWIKTQITNSNGGGPITVYGEVVIQAEP